MLRAGEFAQDRALMADINSLYDAVKLFRLYVAPWYAVYLLY
jgi:hypothetical protein